MADTPADASDLTILHNQQCSTSRAAMEQIGSAGVEAHVVNYLRNPLTEAELRGLIGKLEDPVTDLVRRDAFFREIGLTDADVATEDDVVAVLLEHPRLMQRPVLVRGNRAIIGRPKDRVAPFLAS